MRTLAIVLLAAALSAGGCSERGYTADEGAEENPSYYSNYEKGGETYAEYDERRDELGGSEGSSGEYGCTEDCSGHEAGYQWAEEHDITNPDDCGGYSWSFEEGCRKYAEEQSGDDSEEDEDEEEDEEEADF